MDLTSIYWRTSCPNLEPTIINQTGNFVRPTPDLCDQIVPKFVRLVIKHLWRLSGVLKYYASELCPIACILTGMIHRQSYFRTVLGRARRAYLIIVPASQDRGIGGVKRVVGPAIGPVTDPWSTYDVDGLKNVTDVTRTESRLMRWKSRFILFFTT